ncbi:hypothetical protein LWC35_22165 [Pseudonocardia kujensis]|uniref:PrpF domain-containing protein n=1 Tax=Pseudonocardia kujensis TaxID=1128675 RepID=UPI001E49D71C|nr:PrpF domain-containing protein [Pseudonocardia kujensis]MCE0765588.1 hypothetical protein [Pseudonocardia kujensis]
MRPVELTLARGGTSRGPVLRFDAAPPAGPQRDRFARAVVLGSGALADGLGGGTATTAKIVLVGPGDDDGLDYLVGNLDPAGDIVDWSGTCGNMTAAVVPFAVADGLLPAGTADARLRNVATGGVIEVEVTDPGVLDRPGEEVHLTTTYLDPGGAVLGATLPTGSGCDTLFVDGDSVDCTIVDVAHPYLLVPRAQAQGRLERVRAAACVRLGLVDSPSDAARLSAAVPRLVLLHPEPAGADLRITAVSMSQPVATVPVTAALALAAAARIPGTLVDGLGSDQGLLVAGPSTTLYARADTDGRTVLSASVDRTARILLRGRTWA